MNLLYPLLNRDRSVYVAPSVLAADFSVLEDEIGTVERGGADFLHVDVMDGHFVENITFGPIVVQAIKKLSRVPIITHLMISDPKKYCRRYIEAGSDVVSFHFETMSSGHEEVIEMIREEGAAPGLALNPDTSLSSVYHLLEKVDLLLLMSVFPGFGGRGFIEEVLGKINDASELKKREGFEYIIEVDGGIKTQNARNVRERGAQILVAGTAIFNSADYAATISSIRG